MTTTTKTKTTKIYRTWLERLGGGVLSQSLCRQFAASVSRQAFGYEPQGFRSAITPDEAHDLYRRIKEQGGVRLTDADEKRGLDWLRTRGVKGMGLPADVLPLFSHFTYDGGAKIDGRRTLVVWNVHLTDGRVLSYYWGAWQQAAYGRDPHPFTWWWDTDGIFPLETGYRLT